MKLWQGNALLFTEHLSILAVQAGIGEGALSVQQRLTGHSVTGTS